MTCTRTKAALCAAALAISMLLYGAPRTAQAASAPGARAYALLEASTGRVLASNNANEQLPMASTTKIMTCLLAVEQGNLDDMVTVGKNAVGLEGTSIYLREGETLLLHDLVYGLMLASGNDAAVAIAEHIGGTVEQFAAMMNARAKEIGANNTNFVTPNGLPDDNHYTTAYDLALISCCAMQNPAFREIVGTQSIDLPADEDSPARYLRSKNKILRQVEGGNGIKTGYTKKAGKCLSAAAERDGMQLVAVVLNDYDMFVDCGALLDDGFARYQMTQIATAGEEVGSISVTGGLSDSVSVELGKDIYLPLAENEGNMVERKMNISTELAAPVVSGTQVGTLEFWLNGVKYAETPIFTNDDVLKDTYDYHLHRVLQDWLRAEKGNSANRKILGGGGSGVAA